jgi:cellulose synthase operon protein C
MVRFDSNDFALMRKSLSGIRRELREAEKDPSRWPFREAAAVLSRFLPRRLHPFGVRIAQEGWDDFLIDSEPAPQSDQGGWWRLRPQIRREALRRLKNRQNMRNAMAINPDHPQDPIQRMFKSVIDPPSGGLVLERLPRQDLAALMTVCEWLSGILQDLPAEQEVRRAVAVGDLLEPMRRLSVGFVGRKAELEQLRDYVGLKISKSAGRAAWRFVREAYYDLTKRPPLMVVGVGGIGKSTLLAHFILDYCEEAQGESTLPFVYLDLDLPSIVPSQPISLIGEAARQLSVQWPEFADVLNGITEQVSRLVLSDEAKSSLEGPRLLSHRSDVLGYFARILNEGIEERPVLFVIDTFEEAQFLGPDVIYSMWDLLTGLQRTCPMLRVVIAGRSFGQGQPWSFPAKIVELGDLDLDQARELVRYQIPSLDESRDQDTIDEIINIVGRNPMSLKLASTLVRDQGIQQLRTVETRNWLMLRIKAETMQARLYGRILAHIHEPGVKKLAHPGLLLRRLTPEVIREVLAEPCGLSLDDAMSAEMLMSSLMHEVALVELDKDGSLRHRPDVRRLMLKDLTDDVPVTTARLIHDRAVGFYERKEGAVARAEEIYHRLVRGDDPSSIDKRWVPGVEPYLRTALDELPASARLWLSRRLGVTPDSALLNMADLEQWEEITARSAQLLLQSGDPRKALELIQARRDRSPASPLFRLESEALRLLGDLAEARAVLQRGIARTSQAGALNPNRELLVQLSLLDEISGNLEAALADLRMAEAIHSGTDPIEKLRLIVIRLRLLRKLGDYEPERQRVINEGVALLNHSLREDLERRPVLLREVIAELGAAEPTLLSLGLQTLGLELREENQIALLAQALTEWDKRPTIRGKSGELAARAGIGTDSQEDTWRQFLMSRSATDVSRRILNWRAELPHDQDIDAALTKIYCSNVDAALSLTAEEISASSANNEELLRREWHPPEDYKNRGTLSPCVFSIDPSYKKRGAERWKDWGDVLVRLKSPPNTDDVYLIPSRRAAASFREPDRLKHKDVLAQKKVATEQFSAKYLHQELQGYWFYKTLSRDKRRRVHVYCQEYDTFLNSEPSKTGLRSSGPKGKIR